MVMNQDIKDMIGQCAVCLAYLVTPFVFLWFILAEIYQWMKKQKCFSC